MAKKDSRCLVTLICQECKKVTYRVSKNTDTTKDKLNLNKFCKNCRKVWDLND